MNVCYIGPIRDHSGYGETSRNHIAALHAGGADITIKPLQYTLDAADFGELGKFVDQFVSKQIDYKIRLLHTTPDQYGSYIERGKYNIGFLYWETDKVPDEFAAGLNRCNEVWTASEANAEACRRAGVEVPIYVFPQPMDTLRKPSEPFRVTEFDGYLFYSIFEWIERKNPAALLNAYWQEFQNDENVGLMIKTYVRNFTDANKRLITQQIGQLKEMSGLKQFPRVFLYKELMNRGQIARFHATGDAFVSAHRGEGWGLPQGEALIANKPVISTGYGGMHEYLEDGKDIGLIPYNMVPVSGMAGFARWYLPDQNWADPSVDALRVLMRHAFEHPEDMRAMAERGNRVALEKFSYTAVGKLMVDRLKLIEEGL